MRAGFIGLGTMGQHLANHLQEGGYDLVVNDIREERATTHLTAGAAWAANPSAVMGRATSSSRRSPRRRTSRRSHSAQTGSSRVPRGQGVLRHVDELSGRSCVGSTTDSSRSAWRFSMHPSAAALGAKSGKLVIFVGGDESVYESRTERCWPQWRPAVLCWLNRPRLGGETRPQPRLPASINFAISEAMTMGVRAGVDPLLLWRSIRFGAPGRRRTFDFTRHLHRRVRHTDVPSRSRAQGRAACRSVLGHELNVPMRLFEPHPRRELTEAVERGWGDRDSSAAYLLQQERAGVHIEFSQQEVDETLAE